LTHRFERRRRLCSLPTSHVDTVNRFIIPFRTVSLGSAVAIFDVLFDEYMTGAGDLLPQFEELAFDRALLPLDIGAHARVQGGVHMYESIL
jgi:hypothetical protein